jgi:hypothetical protein
MARTGRESITVEVASRRLGSYMATPMTPRTQLRPIMFSLWVAITLLGCSDDPGSPDDDGAGGASSGAATSASASSASSGAGGMSGDTWSNFAEAWFASYCTECHFPGETRDHTSYAGVQADAATVRCGVTPVALGDCTGFPPPNQFPVGTGAKPDALSRQRLVDWIEAGLPQ